MSMRGYMRFTSSSESPSASCRGPDERATSFTLSGVLPSRVRTAIGVMVEDGQVARARSASQRSEEHTSELQSQSNLVCRLLLEKKNKYITHVSLNVYNPNIKRRLSDIHMLMYVVKDMCDIILKLSSVVDTRRLIESHDSNLCTA